VLPCWCSTAPGVPRLDCSAPAPPLITEIDDVVILWVVREGTKNGGRGTFLVLMRRTPALDAAADPPAYYDALPNETLLMLFEKPSLRTRVSLEVGMTELGGHAIAYMIGDSPLGKKETFGDTAACLSRYCAAVTARVNSRESINGLTAHADIPVVNALDDWAHPMQILADMQTIEEHLGSLEGKRMAYVGDSRNNMTYDLMRGGAIKGFTGRCTSVAACTSPPAFPLPLPPLARPRTPSHRGTARLAGLVEREAPPCVRACILAGT
jgi:hypothetical protein